MNTFVVAFAGHSGAGKSTVIRELTSWMESVNVLQIDDYDSASYPSAVKWMEDGADANEFQTPQYVSDIFELKNGKSIIHPGTSQKIEPARLLFVEEPFGRGREAVSQLIDFCVFIDIPLDVALARRLLRMSTQISQGNTDITLEEHLKWYLRVGRNFYKAVERTARKNCNLVVDGLLPPAEAAVIVSKAIKTKFQE